MGADYEQYPFPEGKHPSGWLETTVGEVLFEIRSGYSSGKHNKAGAGIPHLRPMNVSPVGEIAMDDVRYVSPSAGSLRLAKDDVLFTNTSSTVWVGKTALVEKPGDWGFSNHMTRLRVADGMSPEFVARQLHYLCMSGYFAFHCKKHINQSSVSGTQLADAVPFRLPPANEQKRIAAKLRRLLNRERKLRQQLDELPELIRQYRAAVLEAACTGRLVPTEAELARKERRDFEPTSVLLERILVERRAKWEADQLANMRAAGKEPKGDKWREKYPVPAEPTDHAGTHLPRGWTWASLEQLTDPTRVICYGILMPKAHVEDGVLYVKVRDMKGDIINVASLQRTSPKIAAEYQRASLKTGDILLAIRGTYGRVAEVPKELEGGNITQDTARLAISIPTDAAFVSWQLRSPRLQKYFQDVARGVAVKGVNIGDVRPAAIALPPLNEQKRIVTELGRRLTALKHIEAQITFGLEQTKDLRRSLFRQALSGKFVDQRRADEPAKELLARIRIEREKRKQMPKRTQSQRKAKMKKLSPEVVREAIAQLPSNRFSFDELSAALQADYDPLKDILFELLGEAKPALRQVFDAKTKTMQFERIKP